MTTMWLYISTTLLRVLGINSKSGKEWKEETRGEEGSGGEGRGGKGRGQSFTSL